MILVVNAGSSSLKVEVFSPALDPLISGSVTNIGEEGILTLGSREETLTCTSQNDALTHISSALQDAGFVMTDFAAAAHRVVHGGTTLTAPTRLTPDVIATIEALVHLAPLHNPANMTAIQALSTQFPQLPQYASFDTAFHASIPEVAQQYALPKAQRDTGIRRYGFHGLSYASLVAHFAEALPQKLLAFHLGNGASLCAIKDGQSVATSMGYSPLAGLTMGTRSGDIDGAAVLRMVRESDVETVDELLNSASGLVALAGDNNMKTLLERDDADAAFAVEHFCYWAARHAGSAVVAMGGVDAIAFTGGIGENAPAIREKIMEHLSLFGDVPIHVVKADEEKQIARDALTLMAEGA